MKVILLKDVKKLGREGDVVDVSDGYAMNFLFPQNLGIQASAQALQALQTKKKQASVKEKKELTRARKLADRLDGQEISLTAKMNEHGKLFAAVSQKEVAKALKSAGFDVDPDMIVIEKPMKETGEYRLTLDLPQGLEAEIVIEVVGEEKK